MHSSLDKLFLYSLFVLTISGQTTVPGEVCECETCYSGHCPDGWIQFRGSCYLFVDNLNVDWTEATHHCQVKHNAHLATIESAAEDMFVKDFMMRLFRNPDDRSWRTGKENPFWLGATDQDVEGLWLWYTNDADVDQGYHSWAPHQPDRHNGHDEDCLYLYGPANFTWHDAPCGGNAHPLCEFALQQTTSPGIIG